MKPNELREVQAPLKELYRQTPEPARITLRAEGIRSAPPSSV
jgi:hypothetical protein